MAASPETLPADGRRLRRERNRDAVVDALLGLYRQGNLQPSSTEIAERAGLSARSLFRYFDDIDDLCRAAIHRQLLHVGSVIVNELDVDTRLELAPRIERFVICRTASFEAMSDVGVVARARAPFQPLIAEELIRLRRFLRSATERTFGPELSTRPVEEAADLVAAIESICSFESYRTLIERRDRARAERVMTTALHRLLRF